MTSSKRSNSRTHFGVGWVALRGWISSSRNWIAATAWIFLLSACAATPPITYSLKDDEIFISPRSHPINVAVAVLQDQRSSDEREWGTRQGLPSDLSAAVTGRIIQHLRVSSVFRQVRAAAGPVDTASAENFRKLVSQGVDAVLVGDLVHFYGKTDLDRRIEGHVRFANLKLYSTRTGELLWEGEADKLLQREENRPGRADFYASEALRGAINQLAIQLEQVSFSDLPVYPPGLAAMRRWRVGVMIPEDLRPDAEKSTAVRKLQGDPYYSLYSDDVQSVNKPILCDFIIVCSAPIREAAPFVDPVTEQLVNRLRSSGIFGDILIIKSRGGTSEELRQWSEEGVDVVLVSQLSRAYASVIPPRGNSPFPIWSGGMAYPRLFKVTAMTRLQNVQLIDTRSGRVLWEGEAEYGIDRTIKGWESPVKFVQESLNETLNRLVKQLSQTEPERPVVAVETPPVTPAPPTEQPPIQPIQKGEVPIAKATETPAPEVRALADVYFDFDKYLIREDMRSGLEENVRWMEANPSAKIRIEGHCDERGTDDYNLALGERRAKTVKGFLKVMGIDEDRLSIVSYGEERPVCTEQNEDCYAKNRRVHFGIQ